MSLLLTAGCVSDGGDGGGVVNPPPQITAVALTPASVQLSGAGTTATLSAVVTSTAGTAI